MASNADKTRFKKVLDSVEKESAQLLEKFPETVPEKETVNLLYATALLLKALREDLNFSKERMTIFSFPHDVFRMEGEVVGVATVMEFTVDCAGKLWAGISMPTVLEVFAEKMNLPRATFPEPLPTDLEELHKKYEVTNRDLVQFIHTNAVHVGMHMLKPTQPLANA